MLNLLKKYNQLLEIDSLSEVERNKSLHRIFDRDITNNKFLCFREKRIFPIPSEGMDNMEQLYFHLTTKETDKQTKHREFDRQRSIRLHWLRHHIEERKKNDMLIFSTKNGREKRTYIYDRIEKYVIVLEPKERQNNENETGIFRYYYLLTAFFLEGKDAARQKIENLYVRRCEELL